MNQLQFLRLRRGLTQKTLAELLKIHPVTFCRIERGWLAKLPVGLEGRLRAIFGDEWTFAKLMEDVPDLAENPGKRRSDHAS
jgi:transcriptional regulator with XRE-family HTH domain